MKINLRQAGLTTWPMVQAAAPVWCSTDALVCILHYTGPLAETNDYTPWGLNMKMLESKAFGRLENKLQFNGKERQNKEFNDGGGLEWLDYGARMYDAQVGRWMSIDPEAGVMENWTPYNYTFCEPAGLIDPDGRQTQKPKMCPDCIIGSPLEQATVVGKASGQVAKSLKYQRMLNGLSKPYWDVLTDRLAKYQGWTNKEIKDYFLQFNLNDEAYRMMNWSVDMIEYRKGLLEWDNAMGSIIVEAGSWAIPWSKGVKVFKFFKSAATSLKIGGGFVAKAVAKEGAQIAENEGITIIGEGMARVEAAASKTPGAIILNDMPKFVGNANQITSQMMQYNRKWILNEMRSGRTILDIGRDLSRSNPSIFYQMEQNMLKNYQILHPNSLNVIKP